MIKTCLGLSLLIVAVVVDTYGQRPSKRVKQPAEVVEAYQVCSEFQRLLAEDMDFGRAFDATFTKDPVRRREIAIAESEVAREVVLNEIDDATLIGIYKDQMQLVFPLLLLAGTAEDIGRTEIFPPSIEAIFDRLRRSPQDAKELQVYAAHLKRDVVDVRTHLNQLAAKYPSFDSAVRKFKEDLLHGLKPPDTYVVKPLTSYSKGHVLDLKEKYYQIEDYAVIRENGKMRIIGIRLFSRLF